MDKSRVIQLLKLLVQRDPDAGGDWRQALGATPACSSFLRFHEAILRKDWTAAEREHIAGCRYCQRTIEQVQREVWHPSVLQLFWHSLGRLAGAEAAEVRGHTDDDGCRRCLGLLAVFALDRRLVDMARQIREGGAASGDLATALVTAIRVAESCPLALVVPAQAAGSAGQAPEPRVRRLAFGDSSITGAVRTERPDGQGRYDQAAEQNDVAYRCAGDVPAPERRLPEGSLSPTEYWLTLQDAQGAAGALVQVWWIDDEGRPAWRRFLMFRDGYRNVMARTKLPGPMERGEFLLRPVASGEVDAEDAELLSASFGEARQFDPASESLWQTWMLRRGSR